MSQDTPQDDVRDFNDEFDREDDSDTDRFATPARAREPDEPPGDPGIRTRRPIPLKAASSQSCVMLGPSKSGKTTLLTAIKRACDQPADDGLDLEFIPSKETAERIKIAIHNIVERKEGHEATKDVGSFPFDIHISAKAPNFWSPPVEDDLYVVMSDGGGEFLLPSREAGDKEQTTETFRRQLIEAACKAKSMILCIDVTRPGGTILEKELAISFSEMTKPTSVSSKVHWTAKLWAWVRRRPVPQPRKRLKKCLNADRFLLLLTQVDKLCHRLPQNIDRTVRFAEMIDPVEQARELLGVPVLKTIQNVLKPEAKFAVGVISAMGFHPRTGDPFADIDGTPLNLDSESGEDVLRRWTPFGIRDAIYFLATGKCRGRVKQLQPGDLRVGPEPLDFTYSATSHKEA